MNCLIWNCRGPGGMEFPMFLRDNARIYNWDFIAILEPRISCASAERVINKIGFANCARVDAVGFSGGLSCMWRNSGPNITIVSTSKYCIHW